MYCLQQSEFQTQKEAAWAISNLTISGRKEQVQVHFSAVVRCFRQSGKKGKGKSEHLYSVLHGTNHSKALRHGSHSFQPAKNTMHAFTS